MVKNLYTHCKPGGRVVGLTPDPIKVIDHPDILAKYGVTYKNIEGKDFNN